MEILFRFPIQHFVFGCLSIFILLVVGGFKNQHWAGIQIANNWEPKNCPSVGELSKFMSSRAQNKAEANVPDIISDLFGLYYAAK